MTAATTFFDDRPSGRDIARWTACLLGVLALHAAIVLFALSKQEPVEIAENMPPAVMLDLPPLPQPPSPTLPPIQSAQPVPPPETMRPVEPIPTPQAQPQPRTQPATPPDPARPVQPQSQAQTMPAPEPVPSQSPPQVTEIPPDQMVTAAVLARPPPPKPRAEPPRPAEQPRAQPRPVLPPQPQPEPRRGLSLNLQPSFSASGGIPFRSERSTNAPFQPGSSVRSSVMDGFERRLIEHLARYKRYPLSAQQRREEGIVEVRFTMDAAGNLIASQIVRSSGFASLDNEVQALLRRAQPLPPLPPETRMSRFEVTMPVQFYIWMTQR